MRIDTGSFVLNIPGGITYTCTKKVFPFSQPWLQCETCLGRFEWMEFARLVGSLRRWCQVPNCRGCQPQRPTTIPLNSVTGKLALGWEKFVFKDGNPIMVEMRNGGKMGWFTTERIQSRRVTPNKLYNQPYPTREGKDEWLNAKKSKAAAAARQPRV